MPSRREIREAVVQFLYCADLEDGAPATDLRETFWQFVTGTGQRRLLAASLKTLEHLSQGRRDRLRDLDARASSVRALISSYPEAEPISLELNRLLTLEDRWTEALARVRRLPESDADDETAARLAKGLEDLYRIDQSLEVARRRFLQLVEDFPRLRNPLEAISSTVRRLQRVSDRVRMVEHPEQFPAQTDIAHLRQSHEELATLRREADALSDQILDHKEELDARLAAIVENFAPERVDPVDRAVMRLGTHEILAGKIPAAVAINEAIELAKRFGSTDSGRFVNGVLDKVAKTAKAEAKES